ncbi:MAG: BamA/TamA family outer membrane protein [Candidatus Eisenbacteria bacterium]|nr:BamA/TamA family outer membrane protein [Candidatus Eisenbacteria bacterium]
MKPTRRKRRAALGRRACGLGVLLLLAAAAGPSSGQYFGQNKVPGPVREWRVMETEHFDFHFYEAEREAAEEALRIAERAYARLRRIFDHEISQPIPVLLYASQREFQETRAVASLLGEGTGGVTEFYKRRVIVPLTGSPAELDHVLTHELVHAFQLDIVGNASRMPSVQSLSWMPPLWVVEGLAEYLSVPGIDAHTEMWLRDAVLSGTLPSLRELRYVGDIRIYRFGQAILSYVGAQFGDAAIGTWFRSMALRRDLERGTQESLGITLEKLSEDWHAAVRKRYYPAVAERDDPEQFARRLTDARRGASFFHVIPAVSPDGTDLVYVASDGLYPNLYRASAVDGRNRERLLRGYREETYESLHFYTTTVGWSPDGREIALVAKTGGREVIQRFAVERREVIAEFDFEFDEMRSPTYAPDGAHLAFVGLRRGRAQLYRVDLGGQNLHALTDDRWGILHPDWSPDGQRIAFATDRGYESASPDHAQPVWRLAVLDLRSGAVELLPGQAGKNISPHWFPDGEHLLFVSDRDGISNLYIRHLPSGRDYALTDLVTGVSGITATSSAVGLAENGERAVFGVYEEGRWDLYALDDPLGRVGEEVVWRPEHDDGEPPPDDCEEIPAPSAAGTGADDRTEAAPPDSLDVPLPPAFSLREVFAEATVPPESLQVAERPYRTRFTIDYASAGGLYASGFGFLAAGGVVLTDMLGHQSLILGADVSGSLEEGDYLVTYINQRRRLGFGVSAYQYWTGYGYGVYPGFVEDFEVRALRGVGFGLFYPLSRYRRLELRLDGIYEERFRYTCEPFEENPVFCEVQEHASDAWYAVPEIAWVHDSAIFGSTGPIAGRRMRLSVGGTIGQRDTYGYEADYRTYLNIHRRYAVALRLVSAGDWGADRMRIVFGGPYSLRGYSDDPLAGARIAFANLEFRFPFIEQLRIAWPLPLWLGGLRGALFFDAGAAWDDASDFRAFRSGKGEGRFRLEDIRAAAGFRASINLGFLVLRWDLARRTDLSRWIGKAKGEVSIGWEF